ncbi:anthranilate synthase component I family protein [Pontibacter sp. G13]|uniref:anthranilate synthase component I family protein n=1 Tax=Pontibacter sp. G13 TaxID=3074898 RepID=UPI00288C0C3C|nr:anthranilate synthase component I family protein [Pontibacter sp. G13]WNJ17598.1 anthranilate synthase component I family protein [Pontibacter sp. G13]
MKQVIQTRTFPAIDFLPEELGQLKEALLRAVASYPYVGWFDNCESEIDRYGQYELRVGISRLSPITEWEHLRNREWMGLIPYELKSRFEGRLISENPAWIDWPEVAAFQPEVVFEIRRNQHQMEIRGKEALIEQILKQLGDWRKAPHWERPEGSVPTFQTTIDQADYLSDIHRCRELIEEGEFYEINLSQAFLAEGRLPEPAYWFQRLKEISPVPFASFLKFDQKYLLCASPERFLQLQGNRLLSQPIKGTAPRDPNPAQDQLNRSHLSESIKERAENVMIVDLTRNDLYRSSETASVEVPHLFEIQAFPQVYQMVTSVTGRKRPSVSPSDAIANTFPPGSMTGAPKVRSARYIDQFEHFARGAYAGSLGYGLPNGDFDLNVIIRTLAYDADAERLSYHVGGAITYDSDPLQEYEETLIKARALRKLLES